MQTRSTWIVAALAAAAIVGVGTAVAGLWREVGDAEISAAGWVAMGLGILLTLGLGVGLMALVFFSNRHGYDEPGSGHC